MKHNRSVRKELREVCIKTRSTYPYGQYDFEQIFNDNVEKYIEKGLMKWHSNSSNYLSTWRNHGSSCRFTRSMVRASLSILFLPMVDHNLRIDVNDKLDAEQLAFMEWGDIFVSDDTRFMRRAFDMLYGGTEKNFMSSTDFLKFINQI